MKRKPSRRAAEDAPYEIGYCKPPKHTRFRPGQSGHPSGRPRGQLNFRTAVREALKEKITRGQSSANSSLFRLFPVLREYTGKFVEFRRRTTIDVRLRDGNSIACQPNSLSTGSGKLFALNREHKPA